MRGRSFFDDLRRSRTRVSVGPVRIIYSRSNVDRPAVAFAIGRRVGCAVRRNKIRRRLRAIFSESAAVKPGAYLVSVAPAVAAMSYEELRNTVRSALDLLFERDR